MNQFFLWARKKRKRICSIYALLQFLALVKGTNLHGITSANVAAVLMQFNERPVSLVSTLGGRIYLIADPVLEVGASEKDNKIEVCTDK